MLKSDLRRSRVISYVAVLLVTAVSVLGMECGRSDNSSPTPRRTAYPRIECYDTVYARVNSFPLNLWINFNASVDGQRDDDGSQWLDITYPRYDAVLHLTYTPVNRGTAARVLDNRRERMAMNVGEHRADVTETISQSGVTSLIVKAPAAVVTPLQWVATDSVAFVLSGALEIMGNDRSAEETAPIVEAVYNDILMAARRLSRDD